MYARCAHSTLWPSMRPYNAPLTLDQVFPGQWRNCFLKLQNSTRECLNTPPLFAEPPPGAQIHSLIYRRVSVEGKVRCVLVQNKNDTCVGVQSELCWVQDRALYVNCAFVCQMLISVS